MSCVNEANQSLFTDLYELTMMQAYYREGMREPGIFDLFVRELPETRNFLIACGLDDVLHYLETLSFSPAALDYLDSLGLFSSDFLGYLAGFRFTGSVRAMPEGTPAFAGEPILEVTAPVPEAQLVETYLLNQVTFQTLIASKGVRAVLAAAGHSVIDFGARRMHGTDAALKAARVLYIVGFASTSNVLAGKLYGIPVTGTMAHSYIEAHDSEMEAFREFAACYPETVLLVDTYDTLQGVHLVVRLAEELGADFRVKGVRLDSGDLADLAVQTRRILDEAKLKQAGIVASGGLDERSIADLVASGAPISVFAAGTNTGVSADAPKLDSAYKLVSYAGKGRMKLSTKKVTLPGAKQVFRIFECDLAARDVVGLEGERTDGEPLLVEVMRDGQRLDVGRISLEESRKRARRWLERLPRRLLGLAPADPPYPVQVSAELEAAQRRLRETL
ncbi:MAG: nicotinate phosphoribosyltransferase [Chloroflexi bacterium]|nr:nicotinate phosphoribosyltransferase [Chloroflexota bacterium]